MKRTTLACVLLVALAVDAYLFNLTAEIDKDLQSNFFIHPTQEYSWLGADGTFSVEMGFGYVFFMWQDTWLGRAPYPNGWRSLEGFTRNTVGVTKIENGRPLSRMSYFWKEGPNRGIVDSFDQNHWEWVAGGVTTAGNKLHLLSGTFSGADFASTRLTHFTFHCIDNFFDAPTQWRDSRHSFPIEGVNWQTAIAKRDGFVYVVGEKLGATQWDNMAVISRYNEADLANCNYNNRVCWGYAFGVPAWSTDCSKDNLITLFSTPSENSLHYNEELQKWITFRIPLVSREIWVYTADAPQGPYTGFKVYDMPQWLKDSPLLFTYHPKLHPSLSHGNNDLLLTFSTIAKEDKFMIDNPWVYVPFPIRFTINKRFTPQNIVTAGNYVFKIKTSGYVLHPNDDGRVTQFYLSPYVPQTWNVTISNGRYLITSLPSGRALTMDSSNNLSLRNLDHSSSQRWQLRGTNDENFYYLVSDAGNRAVDSGCKLDANTQVSTNVFWDVGYPCQKFTLERK